MGFGKRTIFTGCFTLLCTALLLFSLAGNSRLVAADDNSFKQQLTEISAEINDPVHDIITQQLEAIKTRDADLAFSLTTDNFHEKFNDALKFLGEIRFEYRPIYNHESYSFLSRHDMKGALLQKVEMEDRYGDPVIVIYKLKEQENGGWLIDSFTILDLEAQPI